MAAGGVGGAKFATDKRRNSHVFKQIRRIYPHLDCDRNLVASEIFAAVILKKNIVKGGQLAQVLVAGCVDLQQAAAAVLVIHLDVDHAIVVFVRVGVEE